MKTYCVSLAVGVLVGVIYALVQVRSPAPPIIALVGLLGMVLGEQIPSLIQQAWVKEGSRQFSMQAEVKPRSRGTDATCAQVPERAIPRRSGSERGR